MQSGVIEQQALHIIRTRRVSCAGLAHALDVSRRTAARAISNLRKQGHRVRSVRDGTRWYYAMADRSARARKDPLFDLIGFVATGVRDGAIQHDHYLYGHSKKR
jgi:biotin operon repressor